MFRTCIIDKALGKVVNIIEYEEAVIGTPPGMEDGFLAVQSDMAQIGWLWDGASLNQPPSTEPVESTKARVWSHIKAQRDAIKAGGVKVGTKWYHTDTESRIQHLGLLEKARAARAAGGTDATRLQALGQDIKWKTMDGSFVDVTVALAEAIFAAVVDLDAAAFAVAEQHRAAMDASADPASYDFSGGWPATFPG